MQNCTFVAHHTAVNVAEPPRLTSLDQNLCGAGVASRLWQTEDATALPSNTQQSNDVLA